MKIGIGRVSTTEQNPQRQIDAFLKEGIDERYIFIDKMTGNGGNMKKREEYQRAKLVVRPGDIVFFDSLDRLGRNAKEIEREWRYFTEEVGCDVVVLNMPMLDTRARTEGDTMGQMVSSIVLLVTAYLAQIETEERKRRQAGGIEAAKRDGKYKGRKPVEINEDEFIMAYKEVASGDRTSKWAMTRLGLKKDTYYRTVAKLREEGKIE